MVLVTTGVCRGAFVTDCGFPVTTGVRLGVLGCAGMCWGVLGCAEVRRGVSGKKYPRKRRSGGDFVLSACVVCRMRCFICSGL